MPICLFIYFTIVHSQLTRFRPHANDFDTVAIPLNEFKHNKALLTRHDAPCPINRSNFYSCIVCKNSARLSMTCTFWVHTDTVPCSSDFRSNASHRIINRKKPYLHILPCLLKWTLNNSIMWHEACWSLTLENLMSLNLLMLMPGAYLCFVSDCFCGEPPWNFLVDASMIWPLTGWTATTKQYRLSSNCSWRYFLCSRAMCTLSIDIHSRFVIFLQIFVWCFTVPRFTCCVTSKCVRPHWVCVRKV